MTISEIDLRILKLLQHDAAMSLDEIGEKVHLSRNACWRRIKALEASGVIKGRVAVLDAEKLGLPLVVMMMVRTREHNEEWAERFRSATRNMPEILGVYRMSGELDYLIRARVADMADYDRLYRTLIGRVALSDVSASFVMEEIKDTHCLPL